MKAYDKLDPEMIRLFTEEGLNYTEIAAKFGMASVTVKARLKKLIKLPEREKADLTEIPEMLRLYKDEGLSLKQVAQRMHTTKYAVRYRLRRYTSVTMRPCCRYSQSCLTPDSLDFHKDIRPLLMKGLNYREIARKLNTSYDYVDRLVRHARNHTHAAHSH